MLVSQRSITRRDFLKSATFLGAALTIRPNWSVLSASEEPARLRANQPDTPYNQAHWLTAHNAYANPVDGYPYYTLGNDPIDNFYTNQRSSITDQLHYGVRALMLDIWWDQPNNRIVCSHEKNFDIPFQMILNEIVDFMHDNPNEVITLFFEDYISGHYQVLSEMLAGTHLWFGNELCEAVLKQGWPTLKQMCQDKTRLVAFMEKTRVADQHISQPIPYLYAYVVETTYGQTGIDGATNINTWSTRRSESAPQAGPAKLQVGRERMSTENTLALVNHFKNTPFWSTSDYANNINRRDFLKQHIDYYIWNNRRVPNFLALDFADVGGGRDAISYLGTKKSMYGFSWTPFIGQMHPDTIDWDTEYFISMPGPWFLVGIEVIDEGGYGITNIMTYGTTDNSNQDLSIFPASCRALDDPNIGWVNNEFKGKHRSFVCPQGTYIDAIQVAKHHQWGIVNLRCHMKGQGWANWITDNEKEDAEVVTIPHIVDRISGFHIKYEGGHGLVDMRYCWSGSMDTLAVGETLEVGRKLYSQDFWYSLDMQIDGNLVLYRSPVRQAMWATGTQKTLIYPRDTIQNRLIMQNDGNLVMYSDKMKPVWASNTNKPENQGAILRLQNDGNLVIYKGTKALWASNTVDR
jgi:hypothetical protein